MALFFSARPIEPDHISSNLSVPLGPRHLEKIIKFSKQYKKCGLWMPRPNDSPEISDTIYDLIIVASPPTIPEANLLFKTLSATGRIVVIGSENPAFDYLKTLFFDYGGLGACLKTDSPHLWWGGPQGLRTPDKTPLVETMPTVVSFYTINTPYEEVASHLIKSCKALGLNYEIVGVDPTGLWETNCALKAGIVMDVWNKVKSPVLWVDADAVIRRIPALLSSISADFAVHKCNRWQMASGTIYFGYSELTRHLLKTWVERCDAAPEIWDQVHLDLAWEEVSSTHSLETLWLPQSYTRIFDRPLDAGAEADPVIEHFQASRKFKRVVSDGKARKTPKNDLEVTAARHASRPRSSFVKKPSIPATGQKIPQMDIFIAGMSRSGSTMLANLMTKSFGHWLIIEPGITRNDMGEHVRLQAKQFGIAIPETEWHAISNEAATSRFNRCIAPYLKRYGIRWGVKEVNAIGWRKLFSIAQPQQTILIVRDLRDVAISAIEKQQRNPIPGQEEQWLLERIISAGSAQFELALTLNESQGFILKYEDFVSRQSERDKLRRWLRKWPISGEPSQRLNLYNRSDETHRHGNIISKKSIFRYRVETDTRRMEFANAVHKIMLTYQNFFGYTESG